MLLPLAAALAATPPEPPDIGVVAAASTRGVTTFPGCARFEGEVRQDNRMGLLKGAVAYTWTAELTEAGWRSWKSTPLPESDDSFVISTDVGGTSYPFVVPLLGAMLPPPGTEVPPPSDPEDEGGSVADSSRRLLLELLDAASTSVELESVEVLRDAPRPTLRYVRSFSSRRTLFGRRDNAVEVQLDADTLRPRVWEVDLEDPVRLDRGGRIVRMALHLETDAEGWPVTDKMDVTGALGPFVVRVDRTITFRRVGECGAGG